MYGRYYIEFPYTARVAESGGRREESTSEIKVPVGNIFFFGTFKKKFRGKILIIFFRVKIIWKKIGALGSKKYFPQSSNIYPSCGAQKIFSE